jgi:hypothetical protein
MRPEIAESLKDTKELIDDPNELNDRSIKPTQILNPEYKKLQALIKKKTLSTKEDGNLPKSGILITFPTPSSVKLRKISLLLEF